jgi:glycosyltransferase involved in cell wall biosynthesis
MHIVFLDLDDIQNPLLGAGQAKATLEVGKRMVKQGHRVTVLCSRYPGYKDRTQEGIVYRHIGPYTNNMVINNILYILALPWYVVRLRADIIIECFTSPMSTLMSPLFTRIPVVALPTSFAADRHSALYHLPFTIIEKFGARVYKYFAAYTQAYLDKMRAYNPTIDARIIPEGVEPLFFAIKQKKPKYILSLGRIDIDQKGLDLLLAAYAKISNKRYPLVIAGVGKDEPKLHELIKKYSLTKDVRFVGVAFGKKKSKLLSEALYVAMPSRNEGFSLFSLEALAAGLPLIVFDIPGFSWAKNGEAVVKAPAFDVAAYAKLLEENMNDRIITKRRALARPTAHPYSWDNVTDKFLTYFTYILKKERKTV